MKRNTIVAGGALATAMLAITGTFEAPGGKPSLRTYNDIVGVKTWCYGETHDTGGNISDKFTKAQCDAIFIKSLIEHNSPFEKLTVDLPDKVHIAMLDITYNIGTSGMEKSSMYSALQTGSYTAACHGILKYKYAGGKDCSVRANRCGGIWTRRQIEFKLCTDQMTVDQALVQLGKLPIGGELQ